MADEQAEVAQGAADQSKASVEANSGLPVPDQAELDAAKAEGVKESVREQAKDNYEFLTNGQNLSPDPVVDKYIGKDEIMQWAHLVDIADPDAFETAINGDGANIPLAKAAGLLELERAGKNRTPHVKALLKRLGVKSPYDVTDAGPPYTNDITSVSKL